MEEEREGLLLSDQCEGTALTSSQGRQPESFLHITREHQLYTQHCLQHLLSLFPVCACVSVKVFSNELYLCIKWPKCWSFSISPSNEYSELISFRIDWFELLAVQGILKSLLELMP